MSAPRTHSYTSSRSASREPMCPQQTFASLEGRRRARACRRAGVAVLTVGCPPAAAHVTVHSVGAVQGAFAEIAFRVPTDSAPRAPSTPCPDIDAVPG
jgi:hypothetical protein